MKTSSTKDVELDEIYDVIDSLMKIGAWKFLNDQFMYWAIAAWRLDLDVLLGYATASLPGKPQLPNRAYFIKCCKKFYPEKSLWEGLE
jgi:hypothetical protein